MTKSLERMSKVDESRILNALEKISSLVNEGEDPNSAITKIAGEMKLMPGFIDPIVFAYNTSRTNIQRKSSDDVFEKAAEFPVADAEIIRGNLYPGGYKTAQAKQRETEVSDEYSRSPVWLERKREKVAFTKTASVKLTDKELEPYPTDESYAVKKAYSDIDRAKKQLNYFKSERSRLFDKCVGQVNELVDYFKTAGCIPFQTIKLNSHVMYGEDANKVLKMVQDRFPGVEKQASKTKDWKSNTDPVYIKVSNLISNITYYNQFCDKLTKVAESVTKLEGQILRPFVGSPKSRSVIQSYEKDAGMWGDLFNTAANSETFKNIASELPGTKPTESLLKGDLSKLVEPSHEQALREVQVEAMLNDLMANDEIISSHKPDDVIRVFNEVNQIAPHAANQKMLVRALLRKRLQYGGDQVDPVDVQQLLDIESKLKGREDMSRGGAMALGPVSGVLG